ncbi:MAG: endonuclease/exonuclease/phosphatase family protein [bacterium]|nr:endonuclease/exonuclease/phosphatase family protein [bacterium]
MTEYEPLRFSAYNIMSGGFASYSHEAAQLERLDVLGEAIRALNADVVGLIDTFRWDEIYSNYRIAGLFGYSFAHNIPLHDDRLRAIGRDNGVALLTKLPVLSVRTIRTAHRNGLLSTLQLRGGLVDLGVVYLDDQSETVRLEQIQAFVNHLTSGRPAILMGDFNTMDDEELGRASGVIQKLTDQKLAARLWPRLAGMKKGEVIRYLRAQGFVDGAEKPAPTVPTKIIRPKFLRAPLFRLDYAWSRGDVQVTGLRVMRDTVFDRASDHYLIVFQVAFDPFSE